MATNKHANEEPLLSVQHLCQYFRFGNSKKSLKAVHNVSFDIYKGETFGLVGESGCGKTTTGRSIIKLYDITGGNIYFKGQRIGAGTLYYKHRIREANKVFNETKADLYDKKNKKEIDDIQFADELEKAREARKNVYIENKAGIAKAKFDQKHCDQEFSKRVIRETREKYESLIANEKDPLKLYELKKEYKKELKVAKNTRLVTQIQMIFQDPIGSLNPRMTVKEIISEGLVIKGITDKSYIDEQVYKILDLVGLQKEHATRYPHEFSGGQRQRIGIARSVIMQPEMIIADEPVSALDVSIQAQVINLLNDLKENLGLTILFIAHDLSVVKYFSDRIGVMYYGDMVEMASSEEIFAHPMHPYTKSLLSAIPLPDPHYEKKRVRKTYNPIAEHDYSVNKPSFREIVPGHFVYCNDEEEAKYKAEYKK